MVDSRIKDWSWRFIAPRALFREKHKALRALLDHDAACHREMAGLQENLLAPGEDIASIRQRFEHFSTHVRGMTTALNTLQPGKWGAIRSYYKKFDFYTRYLLAEPPPPTGKALVLPLSEAGNVQLSGGKGSELARLLQQGITVPPGCVITTTACHRLFNEETRKQRNRLLRSIDLHNPQSVEDASRKLQALITSQPLPAGLAEEIETATAEIKGPLAVRSSALLEDSENSFAGQYLSLLDVKTADVAYAWREVIASKYSPEAIIYRISRGLDDNECAMAVVVQSMVPARTAGVATATAKRCEVHAVVGLGDQLVSGEQTPAVSILQNGELQHPADSPLREVEVREVARVINEMYIRHQTPMEIEWAVDTSGRLFLLQARKWHETQHLHDEQMPSGTPFLRATPVAGGIACGPVFLLEEDATGQKPPQGAVLLSHTLHPQLAPLLSRCAAIVCEQGSRVSHLAIVAREMSIPVLHIPAGSFAGLIPGEMLTVDGTSGALYRSSDNAPAPTAKAEQPRIPRYEKALSYITPLALSDPDAKNFRPEGCYSLHDIIRFCHEKGLAAIFNTGTPVSGRDALRLASTIPLDVYLFDAGGGIRHGTGRRVPLKAVHSAPFTAIWAGLTSKGVEWKDKPFDWDAWYRLAETGATPSRKDSIAFASYAAVAPEYLHFHLRFGYHFAIVDTLCSKNAATNYCMLRFAGGGGDSHHLSLRVKFLSEVLIRLDFVIERHGDYLEARLSSLTQEEMLPRLEILGRLLGASKLMDLVLQNEQMAADCVEQFFAGRSSFTREQESCHV